MTEPIAPPVLVSRRVKATRDQVFRAWTEPELLKKWWGPASFSVPSVELDLRVGGQFVFAMKPPDRPAHFYSAPMSKSGRPNVWSLHGCGATRCRGQNSTRW